MEGQIPEDDITFRLVRAAEELAMMVRQFKEDNPERADGIDFMI